jgi:hypothetical protein
MFRSQLQSKHDELQLRLRQLCLQLGRPCWSKHDELCLQLGRPCRLTQAQAIKGNNMTRVPADREI